MGGQQDKRQEPGRGSEKQQRRQRPGQDPLHPEPVTPSRGQRPEEMERRREEDLLRDEYDSRVNDF
ncbi:hypothetical protein [Streptomyces sp. AP-93]|uniref:hypothetical protein n=1 Tax=Streptomyces sp. AP-93 TaxID=2929048 RepID=UPI001FAEDB3F|nr:hypothetical protein [Streptomyces sp. AP-93]MCJ0872708.1 hypothetical protein [Streptomyces sp. AP-93]